MPDRARFDGPHDEVLVIHPETNELIDTVKRGGLLTKDAPAHIRDELISRDNWTAVKDPAAPSKAEEKK